MQNRIATLLRFGLFQGPTPPPYSHEEWTGMVEYALPQGVAPLLYHCVALLPKEARPPKAILFRLASIASDNERQQRRLQAALIRFSDMAYSQLGLETLVVKGVAIGRYYPTPYLRESGDNDICFGNEAHRIDAWVASTGIEVDTSDDRHSVFAFEGATFENHLHLLYHAAGEASSARIDPRWNTQRLYDHITTLVPHELAFFVAAHMDHHATYHNEPIRMRDLVDWALLIARSPMDYTALNRYKETYDICRFIDLLTQYTIKTFNIPAPEGFTPLSERALAHFATLYLAPRKRNSHTVVRVLSRSWQYLRYNTTYKEIYGQSMFSRFYIHNVLFALKQWIKGQERHQGRKR